jgi:hypothetical protein
MVHGTQLATGVGTQTAALSIMGDLPTYSPPPQGVLALTETYNGTSWSEGVDTNTPREQAGSAGTQTAAIAFGGFRGPIDNTPTNGTDAEVYNGTNWTTVNSLNTPRSGMGGAGTDTAALGIHGPANQVESWNGTNWTEVNDLNSGKFAGGSGGTQTAAIAYGGGPGYTANTESWNGTNWTEVNDLNTARTRIGRAGGPTNALASGGAAVPSPAVAITESWNGTNWSETSDLNTGRQNGVGTGESNTSALVFGGETFVDDFLQTEEFTVTGGIETITSS